MLDLIANTQTEKEIYEVLNPIISDKGLKIVKIQCLNSKKSKLIIFLDKNDGRITVEECADISMEINLLLDIEDIMKYTTQEMIKTEEGNI